MTNVTREFECNICSKCGVYDSPCNFTIGGCDMDIPTVLSACPSELTTPNWKLVGEYVED